MFRVLFRIMVVTSKWLVLRVEGKGSWLGLGLVLRMSGKGLG